MIELTVFTIGNTSPRDKTHIGSMRFLFVMAYRRSAENTVGARVGEFEVYDMWNTRRERD